MSRAHIVTLFPGLLALGACTGKTGDAGGETHWGAAWLHACASDLTCGEGLTCIQHVCTVGCDDDTVCEAHGAGACLDAGGDRVCALPERLACDATTACDADTEGWMCVSGARDGCTQPVTVCSAGAWEAGTLDVCRDTIAHGAGPDALEVEIGDPTGELDVLVMMDNSSSMNLEQRGIALAFDELLARLGADADVRLAVTTPDVMCDPNGTSIFTAKGLFNQHVSTSFPRAAQFTLRTACSDDTACEAAACDQLDVCGPDEHDRWRCQQAVSDICTINPNGSVNTTCARLCTTDDDCRQALGDPDFVCQKVSADPEDWRCQLPPPTASCPASLPPFLEGDDLALAHCALVVGVNQEKCMKYEQGLEGARMALDPTGPNAAQAAAFMRPEAQLAVIFISDEDDCSSHAAIGEDDYETCALLADADHGGPLVPVADYAAFLRDLKPAGRVSVLASTGLATGDGASADYAAYLASKGDSKVCYHQTLLCDGPAGGQDWGRRYVELAALFGADGGVDNLCDVAADAADSDAPALSKVGSALELEFRARLATFAERIAANARRVCLPGTGSPTVTLVRAGATTPLGADAVTVVKGAAECANGLALVTRDPLRSGDRLRITLR